MANKTLARPTKQRALSGVGKPATMEAGSELADATAKAAASLREWLATALHQPTAPASSRRPATAVKDWESFVEHYAALNRQLLALQFQVGESLVQIRAAWNPLAALRYSTARRAFPSDADMAQVMDVHRSQITRWKQGSAPDPENAERLLGLDVVISLLEGFLEGESIPKWLRGINAHLGHRRPLDVLKEGRLSEVIRAIEAEKSGAFA